MCDYFAKKIEKKRFFARMQIELPFFSEFLKSDKKKTGFSAKRKAGQ